MEDELSRLDEEDESSSFERASAFDRLGDPKLKKPRTSAFDQLQDTRSARKGNLRVKLKERRGESSATSKIGSEERLKVVEDKEAIELWRMCDRLEKRLDAQNPYRQVVFSELPKGSIDKWSDLAHKFLEHFASSWRQKLPFSHLLNVKIRKGEQLREFINRWEKEARDVQGADDQALIAMLQAALPQGNVRKELRQYPLSTYQEMLARAKYLALEEEDDEPPIRKEKKSGQPVTEGRKRKDFGRGPNPTGYQRRPAATAAAIVTGEGQEDGRRHLGRDCDDLDEEERQNHRHLGCRFIMGGNTGVESVSLRMKWKNMVHMAKVQRPPLPKRKKKEPLIFTDEDYLRVLSPHRDALVIKVEINNVVVHHTLVDTGSSVNIMYSNTFKELGLSQGDLKPIHTPLSGFTGDTIEAEGTITVKAGERMGIYIQSTNFLLWRIIKTGEDVPMKKVEETNVPKTEDEYDAQDIKKVENNAKAINIIYCAVNPDDYRKISCCTIAKEMWDKLEITYEADAIQESIGITNVTIDGLRGNLKTYESTILFPSLGEQKKKGIALKATSSQKPAIEKSSDEDNECGLVIKKFHNFMRKEYERKGKKHGGPPKCYECGEVGHIKPKCPNAQKEKEKKPFKKHRAYISWRGDSSDESSEGEENESANLCLMAHEEPPEEIMMEAHLYALHDCMWMVLEDGPLKIQMENPERNPTNPDVVQYIPKPKEKWDDRDCKKHNLDNVAKAGIFKTLDPITFSKIMHLKTAMEIWQGLGKLCEGSEDLRKQKIEVLLEKFKSFKMLPGESFDMLDERFHKILNDLASLNHVLSPKEKNVRLLKSLPAEWYTKATSMEEGRNLENYAVQGLLDELRTYEHELKKKKEEQVTPFPTALMTTPRVPTSEGTCPRNCDTPSSSQPSKTENYDEEFAMMVKQFRKFKKFFKKADSVRRPSKRKPQVSDSPPESYLCYNCRKPGHWKSACPYPKVEKYGERERNEKKKKAMVAAESDNSSSSSSDEEALVCVERRTEKSNHEDWWTMSEDDTLCLMAKNDADQEVTSQTFCSSSYESIPTSENIFDKFKQMMEDFEEINLKHSSLTEENKLLSEENLKLTEGRKSQLSEITQLRAENESLSEKVKFLNKELRILKSKEAVHKLLEKTKHKGREGLGFNPSSSKRKGRTTFIPPKPTAKPNKQKGKEKEKPTEVPKKDMASLKTISSNEVILSGKRIRNIYEVMWDDVKEACLISKVDKPSKHDHEVLDLSNKDEEINEGDRMKPTEFIPFGSLPLKTSQRNPDSAKPTGNHGQPSNIPDHSHGDHSRNGGQEPIHPETPTNSVLQPEAELDQPVNPNQHNLRWLRDHPPQQVIGDIQSGVRTRSAQQNLEAMLACFISQVEPKSIEEALADSDWINAMQE
ncbi:unnamed protein product [Cuscuta campestris]|uniref:CCHC-type domain-containing protein n=1 Tax=Cuscuta campestris TaxID=132261 RepID=A0A484LMF4_9ASTE|nr:unnamed protein product [Cuscuta campestris]